MESSSVLVDPFAIWPGAITSVLASPSKWQTVRLKARPHNHQHSQSCFSNVLSLFFLFILLPFLKIQMQHFCILFYCIQDFPPQNFSFTPNLCIANFEMRDILKTVMSREQYHYYYTNWFDSINSNPHPNTVPNQIRKSITSSSNPYLLNTCSQSNSPRHHRTLRYNHLKSRLFLFVVYAHHTHVSPPLQAALLGKRE